MPLTDPDDDEQRARAVDLVARAAARADLRSEEAARLAEFFTGKLSDWACARTALQGCAALVADPGSAGAAALDARPELAIAMARTLAAEVQLPSLAVSARQAGLRLWLALLERFGPRLATEGGVSLAAATARLADGENDPRCLLLAFGAARAACAAYGAPGAAVAARRAADFASDAAELFEVAVEPYFPVRFTPKRGDPAAITRAQLAAAVADCMAAAPEFAALAVPLLSEKLGSALREAKEDVLDALPRCCAGWGAGAVAGQLQQVRRGGAGAGVGSSGGRSKGGLAAMQFFVV